MRSSAGSGVPGRGMGGPGRWAALGLGLVVLIAVFVLQHHRLGPGVSVSTPESSAVSTTSSQTLRPITSGVTPASSAPMPTTAGVTATGVVDPSAVGSPSAIGSSQATVTSSPNSSPAISAIPPGLLPGASDWELLGYGTSSVVRFRPGSGRVVVTPVSGLASGGPLFFLTTATAAIIRPLDPVTGYAVPDGQPATELTGLLAQGGPALPGPDAGHLWIATGDTPDSSFVLVDAAGRSAGQRITLPPADQSSSPQPDGTGYLLISDVGGTYLARPGRRQLVTVGTVLATGPTTFLVYECDRHGTCSTQAIDRHTGRRRAIPHLPAPSPSQPSGPISADGQHAAILEATGAPTAASLRPHLVNLVTGRDRTVLLDVDPSGPLSSTLAFSPDGHYLLVDTGDGQIAAVDTRTGHITRLPLPIPSLTALAVRPTH